MIYTKTPYSPEQLVTELKSRGLIVDDEVRAKKYLINVGYYRLTGYMYHLQSRDGFHTFKEGVSFNDIVDHYKFDKALRALFSEYLERVEVALRAKLIDEYSQQHGFKFYTERVLFHDNKRQEETIDIIQKNFDDGKERFLVSFKLKYSGETLPPANLALQTLSFGQLASFYTILHRSPEKNAIASHFGLSAVIIETWFPYLSQVRNICAHHGRLWNRRITVNTPTLPRRPSQAFSEPLPSDFRNSIYGVACMVYRLLNSFNPNNTFIDKLKSLFAEYPNIDKSLMGFPDDWETKPAYRFTQRE